MRSPPWRPAGRTDMGRRKIDLGAFEALGEIIEPPPPQEAVGPPRKWKPRMTPKQEELFNCKKKYVLCWGPKGGSKSFGVSNLCVKHAWENENALVLIMVRVQNMAVKGGAWDILINEVLPRWRDGNMDREGNKLDEGFGLVYTDVKYDQNHCPYVWILNRYGKWSMISLMSCPHANQLRDRIKSVVPSMVFLDEVTSCDDVIYFQSPAAQLGRRPRVKGIQQFIGATNPEDPEHWAFKRWFIDPYQDEDGNPCEKDEDFHDIFFPAEDNKSNLPPGYLEGLKAVYGKNATEALRMIGGQWVSVPSGDSLFLEVYNEALHVRPLQEDSSIPDEGRFIIPSPDHPIIVGVDSGLVHHAFVFLQRLPIDNRMRWLVFDEVVLLRRKLTYGAIMPVVMRRIRWWRDLVRAEMPMIWISDDSAFNMFRPGQGTYDSLDMERAWNAQRQLHRMEKIKILPAPKFSGSVEACIRIEQTALADEEIIISSRCKKVRAMYNRLESEKQKPGEPFDPKKGSTPRRSDHLHVFAAGVYPKLAASLKPSIIIPRKEGDQHFGSVGK